MVFGFGKKKPQPKFYTIRDKYKSYNEIHDDLRKFGMENVQSIIAIDVTASNIRSGLKTFGGKSLHTLSQTVLNPYQTCVTVLDRINKPFDDDGLIPCYYFGDVHTKNHSVRPFKLDDEPCQGAAELLEVYARVIPTLTLSGGTNFAPIIHKAVEWVRRTGEYHILYILTDGIVVDDDLKDTRQAIIEASQWALSIVIIGVGDGPWDEMKHLDNDLPERKFDNVQFVDFSATFTAKGVEDTDLEFARVAIQEIPAQYKAIKDRGYLRHKLPPSYA